MRGDSKHFPIMIGLLKESMLNSFIFAIYSNGQINTKYSRGYFDVCSLLSGGITLIDEIRMESTIG